MNQGAMPAYPVNTGNEHVGHQTGTNTWQFVGMSKREEFAKAMMAGILANRNYEPPRRNKFSRMAEDAVAAADALLAALSDQPTRQEDAT